MTIDYFINLIEEVKKWSRKEKGKDKVLNLSVFQTLKEKHEIEKAEILESSNKQFVSLLEEAMPTMGEENRKAAEELLDHNRKSVGMLKDLI